jgi:sarcosine oxidase
MTPGGGAARPYDEIVLGLGVMGSAAAWHLARRGRRVLAVDAHAPGHRLGASHGHTRIIRKAYFEDPAYVPLLDRAYQLWDELARETGAALLQPTGGLMLGPPEAPVIAGALRSARAHDLPYELLTAREVRRRFPAFTPDDGVAGLWEPQAGILFPERCVRALQQGAERAGAELRFEEPVRAWQADGSRAIVETSRGRYEADTLVIAAGPWAPSVLARLGLPLEVFRQVACWFEPARPEDAASLAPDRCPLFIGMIDGVHLYGLPGAAGPGFKVAIHDTGEWSDPCTPETVRRDVAPEEVEAVRRLLRRLLPGLDGPLVAAETCLYTMTPDAHFVIDRSAGHPRLVYAAGFSGHGFKFGGVVGEILADLATAGRTAHPIAFLSAERFREARPAPA